MKLHWSPRSPYVRKVLVVARELGLNDSIQCVRSVADMRAPNPDLMADNPLSKIPAMVLPSGEVLVDSGVICEYLDTLAGGNILFPAPGPDRWSALTWQALATGLLDVLTLWRNERDKAVAMQFPAWLDAFALKTDATLDRLERDAPRLASAPFGIGHVAVGCCLSYLDFRFAKVGWREGRPELAALHEAFRARPSAMATEPA
jgi:glutathione S-transferase